jgi:hypothetical protein
MMHLHSRLLILSCCCFLLVHRTLALNVVLAGGTGPIGAGVASKLDKQQHSVTILTRNAFLAATPNRVTEQYGWVGESFMRAHPYVKLRDWDGGDLLDIVGSDWLGWQQDVLVDADVVVHLVGEYTDVRTMACERLVRESLTFNRKAHHITVNPTDEALQVLSRGAMTAKKSRIDLCEAMVRQNCQSSSCLRIEAKRLEQSCNTIVSEILKITAGQQ